MDKKFYTLILVIVLCYLINNLYYFSYDTQPPVWDEARHLTTSLEFYDALIHGQSLRYARLDYGPFAYIATIPFLFLFGRSSISILLTQIFFLVVLLYSTYGIAEHFFGKKIAYTALLLTAGMPILFGLTKIFLLDFILSSLVTLALLQLLKTDFSNIHQVIILVIIYCIGILTKLNFLFFVLLPTLLICYQQRKNFKYILLFGILLLVIGSPWYILHTEKESNVSRILDRAGETLTDSTKAKNAFTLSEVNYSVGQHLVQLSGSQTNYLVFVLFLIGIASIKRHRLFFLGWMILPYFFFAIIAIRNYHVDTRYLTPFVPSIIILASYALYNFKHYTRIVQILLILPLIYYLFFVELSYLTLLPFIFLTIAILLYYSPHAKILIGGLLLISIAQLFYVAYDYDLLGNHQQNGIPHEFVRQLFYYDNYNCWLSRPINTQDWPYAILFSELPSDAVVGILSEDALINTETLRYYTVALNAPFSFESCLYDTFCFTEHIPLILATDPIILPHTDPKRKSLITSTYKRFQILNYSLEQTYLLSTEDPGNRCGFNINAEIQLYKKP